MKVLAKKSLPQILLFSVALLGVAGCSTTEEKSQSVTYSETEKSPVEKGMENQPEVSYWFPEELLEWEFAEDPDAKYNVSHFPLAKRVEKSKLPKSNETQNDEMKVVALSIMNSSTSGNSPRGLNTFDANVFSNWQYIDQLVYWGGSSGEGIIVPPSADVIDAAHKNGVPVLGTVFFPQTAHGGKIEWLDTFLEKDANGHFPIVDKLIEVSQVYGFDGWFINQETDTKVTSFDDVAAEKEQTNVADAEEGLSKKHADLMQELIAEFKTKSEDQEIMWYDSMTGEGEMDWQNALTDKNKAYFVDTEMNPLADSMFLNFWWTTDKLADQELLKSSRDKAKEVGRSPYDLYAGIDVQENGYMTPVKWDLFTNESGVPYTSLGLYVPSWTYTSANNPDEFQEKESMFWVNGKGDSRQGSLPENNEWPGISTFAVEQTAVTNIPFTTNFNLGNGYNYFIEGEKVSSRNWHNRSLQDIMPTYRWQFDHGKGNELVVLMDYADAYNGGNSMKLRGTMQKETPSLLKLYSTQFTLENDITISTTAKATSETELKLVLGFEDGATKKLAANRKIGTDWTTVTFDTKSVTGKVVTSISYELQTSEDVAGYDFHLGQLAVRGEQAKTKLAVSGVSIEDAVFDEEESNYAGVRFVWEEVTSEDFSHYEIYRVNEDDTRSFLGATPINNFYVNGLERDGDDNQTIFEVVPVDQYDVRGKASNQVTLEWPDNRVPKANFTASRTLIAPGETVTFQNLSSTNTEEITWEFKGADIETSKEDAPAVTYSKAGVYSVKLTATNKSGETPLEMEQLITVTDKAKGELTLLSQDVSVEASSFVNDGEAPKFAVDGKLDTKWCAVGAAPHSITLDLGTVRTVSEVHIDHAEAGGEGAGMNSKAYTIEVSEDGQEFTQVTRVLTNDQASTVDTFAAGPIRFVRLTLDKPTQEADSAARIYEIGVYGLETPSID
ncbi:discoidin domain-containing protein [Enterococcus saccharolyticus]|uniref:endo-beta-N-acetylglucosaminidase n=1 Tax=Enterococcus saccharolyticus TaxID=41997 RepID=UPI001E4CF4B8|nr:discoidin domain-containing protein [Enterococcus saccharolyticus]MCD5002048.1 discoidin domain-containing protein [Enterococcus saccharolyticus]